MNVFKTTFKKKNGDLREMIFVEVKDLPKNLLQFKGDKKTILPESMKLVWDVEATNFRVINQNELLEEVKQIDELTFEEIEKKYSKSQRKE